MSAPTELSMSGATIVGKVTATERLGCTVWGNPMHRVTLDNGRTYRVSNDASLSYEIENREFRSDPHTFHLTRSGRISHAERIAQ